MLPVTALFVPFRFRFIAIDHRAICSSTDRPDPGVVEYLGRPLSSWCECATSELLYILIAQRQVLSRTKQIKEKTLDLKTPDTQEVETRDFTWSGLVILVSSQLDVFRS